MTQQHHHQPAVDSVSGGLPPDEPEAGGRRSVRGRRAVLAAGATTALGAVGALFVARPAEAAPGASMLLGRPNWAGTESTTLSSATTAAALAAVASKGHGVLADAATAAKWGVYGRATSTSHGPGGGVRGEGRKNVGVLGTTTNSATFGVVARNSATAGSDLGGAVMADGGKSTGVVAVTAATAAARPALYAEAGSGAGLAIGALGAVDVEGTFFCLEGLVGIQSGNGANPVAEAPVVSGDTELHTASGRVTLDGDGTGSVTLSDAFIIATELTQAVVQLTPLGEAMSGLHATLPDTDFGTFQIGGGADGGEVCWTVTAPRKDPFDVLDAPPAASALSSGRSLLGTARPRTLG